MYPASFSSVLLWCFLLLHGIKTLEMRAETVSGVEVEAQVMISELTDSNWLLLMTC
jgi:hypothetical protein